MAGCYLPSPRCLRATGGHGGTPPPTLYHPSPQPDGCPPVVRNLQPASRQARPFDTARSQPLPALFAMGCPGGTSPRACEADPGPVCPIGSQRATTVSQLPQPEPSANEPAPARTSPQPAASQQPYQPTSSQYSPQQPSQPAVRPQPADPSQQPAALRGCYPAAAAFRGCSLPSPFSLDRGETLGPVPEPAVSISITCVKQETLARGTPIPQRP